MKQSGGNPKISEATDEQLFALMVQRGEEAKEAWATFYRRYIEDFYQVVCRLPGVAPADINDLVQETMIQAWKSAHTFQGSGHGSEEAARRWALAWLRTIARNHYWGRVGGKSLWLAKLEDKKKKIEIRRLKMKPVVAV